MRQMLTLAQTACYNVTATPVIYTLSLHDALPICWYGDGSGEVVTRGFTPREARVVVRAVKDRKSTRLNSSHTVISYAVFCLKKKNNRKHQSFQATAGFRDYAPNAYLSSNGWSEFYQRSEERFSRNAETELVCRLLLEKKKTTKKPRRLNVEAVWTTLDIADSRGVMRNL